MLKRPVVWIPTAVVLGAVAIFALVMFQPWKLFVDQEVNEALPIAQETTQEISPDADVSDPSDEPTTMSSDAPEEPTLLADGSFISHEHETTGTVRILELPDGQRVLRIEGLDTSNGPDLKVWLTDAPVIEGEAGWYVFDDGKYVDLGVLKGNLGNANYPIPDDVDLTELTSLTIWCDRFSVSFGAAELTPTV
jgi:hypothetical protein